MSSFSGAGKSKEVAWLSSSAVIDGEGNGTPLQYSCLENPMDRGAWKAAVCGVAEGRTRLSDFTFTFHFHALEKEMATHSSVLAWRIPGIGESGGLPSMGSHRVRHDWSDLAAAADNINRERDTVLPSVSSHHITHHSLTVSDKWLLGTYYGFQVPKIQQIT